MFESSPAKRAEAIVTDTNFSSPSRGIYVSGAGDVSAIMYSGGTIVFIAVPAGSILPIQCTQITTANTTATDMIVLW